MNVEINLLEQKPKKNIAPYLLGILAFLLIASVASGIVYQIHLIENSISSKEKEIEEIETLIAVNQEAVAEKQKLIQLQETLESLEQVSLPSVPMYHDVLNLLDDRNQLFTYETIESNQLLIEANLPSLVGVAEYVSRLLERPYVIDVTITGVRNVETVYSATLTVYINEAALKKELSENE